MTEVWKKVYAIAGTGTYKSITSIRKEDGMLSQDLTEIAETLADQFASISSNKNCKQSFSQTKTSLVTVTFPLKI